MQGTGGSLLSSNDPKTDKIGAYIIIGGLAFQVLSFALYVLLVYYAYWSLKRHGVKPFEEPWGKILQVLFFTSALFLVCRFHFHARVSFSSYLSSYDASIAP